MQQVTIAKPFLSIICFLVSCTKYNLHKYTLFKPFATDCENIFLGLL